MTSANQSGTDASTSNRKSQTISCAECRRLKLKCDRVFPCSSCIRRGCANLCPNGTLEKGKRGFLRRLEQSLPSSSSSGTGNGEGSTEVAMFVARDKAMANRIQELEMALTNAGVPIPGAPMLHSKALKVEPSGSATPNKRPRSSSPTPQWEPPSIEVDPPGDIDTEVDDVALGFGTLTIDVENRSRYIGLSGSAAYLNPAIWKTGKRHQESIEDVSPGSAHVWSHNLNGGLPSYEEAVRLADLYFTNASWMYEVIPRDIFFNEHLASIYFSRHKTVSHGVMSLFYIVLSMGAFFDLSLPMQIAKDRASHLHSLAVQWLSAVPPPIGNVPLEYAGKGDGEPAGSYLEWQCARYKPKVPSRWLEVESPEPELEERRRVFWETHYYDRVQSLTFGRPYAMSDDHHDCEMPQTCDTPLPSDSAEDDISFSHKKQHRGSRLCCKHPTYTTIMELDKEINDYYSALPKWMVCESVQNPVKELRPGAVGLGSPENMRRDAQIHSLCNMIYLTLLHLHRGPFCRALTMDSSDPLKAKYASSVTNLTVAARAMINITRGMFSLYPVLTVRMWYFFFHTFSAAVCQAVLVIVAPFHPLSPQAYESMQGALELFTKAKSVMDGWKASNAPGPKSTFLAVPRTMPRRLSESSTGQPEHLLGASTTLIRIQAPERSPDPVAAPSSIVGGQDIPHLDLPGTGLDLPSAMERVRPHLAGATIGNVEEAHLQNPNINMPSINPDLNIDGFDLSSFIQVGANPWSGSYEQHPLDIDNFFGTPAYH
ncbi:hypothetical protein CPB85DRAFT_1439660 [Mucidula mucida]|nr:hypothetical protein CPB85DRAFT_1439660 [Mucidula mucida]